MNTKWMVFTMFAIMFLTVATIVTAENSTDVDNSTDYVGKSINLRYENLICKIDFTVGQIDVIDEYASNSQDTVIMDKLLNDKDTLENDKDDLKDIYDEKNLTEFNNFLNETLHPDFIETSNDLREFKKEYKTYIAEDDRIEFRDALTALKTEYDDCTNTKYSEMSKLMDKYYKHKSGMWDQIIKSMNQRNLSTENMTQIREQLQLRLQDLEDAMNSGNQTQLREQLQQMKDEHLQLWAKFHSGRLNSYLNRIEPAANKYGRSDEFKKIQEQLKDIQSFAEQKNRTQKEYAKMMMQRLHDSGDEMRNMSKDMLQQRINYNKKDAASQNSNDGNKRGPQ
jgi:hypothetical protein